MDTKSDNQSLMLLKEYEILIDLLKHQHYRIVDTNKTFLTANTILVGACAIIFRGLTSEVILYLIPLAFLGMVISFFWICASERIAIDTDLKFYQLRYTERDLGRPKGIFISGYDFFFGKKRVWESPDSKEKLDYPKDIWGKLSGRPVSRIGRYLPIMFGIVYFVLILMVSFSSSNSSAQ